jgi:hypothetical protein
MFKHKYIAINDLTGLEVKRFRTLRGATRWYRRPTSIGDIVFVNKAALFISVYAIDDLLEADVTEEKPNAFELMQAYAAADAFATTLIQGNQDKTPGWCELCQVNHYDDGVYTYDPAIEVEPDYGLMSSTADMSPTLPGLEEPMPHWERQLLGGLDVEPGEVPQYCPNDCEDCDNLKAQAEAEAIAEAESNDALRTLRAILGAEVIEENFDDVVLISVDDFINQLWTDDEFADTEDLVTDQQLTYVVHGYDRATYTAEEAPHVFYQLTPGVVKSLGEFVPVTIETPEEFNDKLVLQQAREFYQGLAAGVDAVQQSDLTGLAAREASKSE